MKQLFVDNGDMNQPDDSYVYKMMFLFQSRDLDPSTTLAAFDKFVQKYINGFVSLKAFLEGRHIASFEFPANLEYGIFDYDLVAMRKALPALGYTLLKNLADIGKIQASNDGTFPQDIATFKHSALKAKFPNAAQNIKLAELCNLYDGNVAQFDDMIALMENGVLPSAGGRLLPKAVDNLPDVIVPYVNPETGSNYCLVKLPSHDLRAMMLGNITGNCQTLSNGDADPFIIDGITRPNNGFYVIIKEGRKSFDPANIDWENLEKNGHEIVGQSYAWIGRDGKSITWEAPQIIKDRAPNIDITEVLTGFGKAIESQGFDRVTTGRDQGIRGAQNADTMCSTESHNIFKEGFRYSWSADQHNETYVSAKLEAMRKKIAKVIEEDWVGQLIGWDFVRSVISVQQGEALLQFLPGKRFNLTMQKAIASCYLTKEWSLEKLESLLSILEEKSEAELESILQHKALYHYGLTIEYALKIPAEVMTLLDAIVKPHHGKRSKLVSLVTSLDELAENIASATSILDIQKAAVKLIAKNICDDAGDLAYVDTMSESKIDFIVNNYNAINLLYKKAYTVSTIAELEDTKFSTLAEHYGFIQIIVNYTGQTMQEYVGKFESSLVMKRDILKNLLTHPLMPKMTCDPSVIDSLSEEKLDLLLKHEILGIPAYSDILNAAPTSDVLALKKQIFVSWAEKNSLFENIAAIDIPEAILDILLSSEVMRFYLNQVKHLDPVITEYFMQLENLIQLPPARLKLLFSDEAKHQYLNGVSPAEWVDMDVDTIIKSFEKVVHVTGPHYTTYSFKDELQRVLPEEVLKHFGIDALYQCFSDASYTYVPSLITTDRFTVEQKIKILQQVLDGSLGDKLSEIVGSVGCIACISNISPEKQEQITQYSKSS